MITQDEVKQLLEYKEGSLYWLQNRGGRIKAGDRAGSFQKNHSQTRRSLSINYKTYLEHRIIFLYHYGYMPETIDHIDGNPSNNCIENLRACSQLDNNKSRKIGKDNTSGVKGVSFCRGKWHAKVTANGVQHHLGVFTNVEAAKAVVEKAREKLHGAFTKHG